MARLARGIRNTVRRNWFDTVSWSVAIAGLFAAAVLTNSVGVTVVVAVVVALARWTLSVWRTERTHRMQAEAEQRLGPQRRAAAEGLALAAARAIRAPILYRDVPAAHPRDMYVSALELARGADPEANWSPTESDRIRRGIEGVITGFKTDVGPYAVDVPEARLDVQGVIDDLEDAADKLLAVGNAANHRLEATWASDAAELERRRDEVEVAVAAARERLRSAVERAMRLIHHEDPEAARDALKPLV